MLSYDIQQQRLISFLIWRELSRSIHVFKQCYRNCEGYLQSVEEAWNFLYQKHWTLFLKHKSFQEPELLKPFSNLSLTNDITNANNKNYIESLDELADIIEPWLGYGEISDKLRDIEQNFSSRISKCVENRPDGIKVLNHGDLWINNVLFKYEKDNTPKDLSFVSIFIAL